MRRPLLLAILAVIGGGLIACTALDPYETVPVPPPPGVTDAGPRIGICYDSMISSPPRIQAAAQAACAAGTIAVAADTEYQLDLCPLLLPARATFVCTPKK